MDFPELVDPENADFAGRMLDQRAKIVRMPEAGHFILWQAPEVVIAEILALLSRLRCG
jgi:pimeloyl-ACP methyl ester carboxylesterase